MKRSTIIISMLTLTACGAPAEGPTGSISFSLTATDSGGAVYRLRNATFGVEGYPDDFFDSGKYVGGTGGSGGYFGGGGSGFGGGGFGGGFVGTGGGGVVGTGGGGVVGTGGGGGFGGWGGAPRPPVDLLVSTEEDPNAQVIKTKVPPGGYTVDLKEGWHLERITERGWERVQQVVLLSPTSQHVYVWDGGTSHVNYRLGVDGTLIDFRSGEISIGIDVVVPGENKGGSGGHGGFGGTGGYPAPGGYGGHYPR